MFSLLRLLNGGNSSNTNSLNNTITNVQISDTNIGSLLERQTLLDIINNSNNSSLLFIKNLIDSDPYVIFIAIIVGVFILTTLTRFVLFIFTKKPKSNQIYISKKLWKTVLSPKFIWLGLLLGFILAIDILRLPLSLTAFIKRTALSVFLWIIYNITSKIITIYKRAILLYKSKGTRLKFFRNKNLFIVFARATHFSWLILFLTAFLGIWGVELAPILAGLGIVGIVVGLALQDSLSHVFGGVSLMLDETYSEGDYVILENGNEGIIFQIGYRSTKLRTFDEEIIIIPNGILSKMIITNLSQPVKRIRVTSHYYTYAIDGNPDTIKELLLLAVKHTPVVLNYPEPYVFFIEPLGNLYHFRLNYYISTPLSRLTCSDYVHQEVVKLFQKYNIRFAFSDEKVIIQQNSPLDSSKYHIKNPNPNE